jgi:hypothetical protein
VDPAPLANPEWLDIGKLLSTLWGMVALVVFFATNILIGHIFIPSLVASGHLPEQAQKTRSAFYVLALASFGASLFLLSEVVDLAGVLRRIWEDFWI